MYLVPNLGWIEEDCEVSLAFWGMESCIFDGTQGATILAKWLHDMDILFRLRHVGGVSSGFACQPTLGQGGSCMVP